MKIREISVCSIRMACAWLCSLSLLFLLAGLCDATDYNILDFAMARRHELWMAEYGKVYGDEAEKAHRFEIFKKNVKYIENFNNAGNHSHTLGINEFADLTSQEVVDRYIGSEVPEISELQDFEKTMEPLNLSAVPSSVDWRESGAVTRVKHQGGCYCCWAFTAVATVESLVKINTDILYELSEQQIVDCDNANKHCSPGYLHKAFDYIKKNGGLTTSPNYPYTAVQSPCDAQKAGETVATISGYKWGPIQDEQAMKAVVATQPIGVFIDASSEDFIRHKEGIFRGPCGIRVNHFVTVVGYGEEGSIKYWIVKNSWGDKWGDSGYIKMEREVAPPKGLCAIAFRPIYPVM